MHPRPIVVRCAPHVLRISQVEQEIQKLYETILNKKLDRRNFQRKMLGFGIFNKLNETRKGGAHKAPFLYTFNDKKYQKALKDGLYGSW